MPISYEAVEGTKPGPYTKHDARTLQKVITPGPHHDDHDLHMMTEIGDGVFVAWTNCRTCTKRVANCKCAGGPVEPPYMVRWRQERFEKELNARPEPPIEAIPMLLSWLRGRGYTITKPRGAGEEPEQEPKPKPLALDKIEHDYIKEDKEQPEEAKTSAQVDKGLDAALAKVREVKAEE